MSGTFVGMPAFPTAAREVFAASGEAGLSDFLRDHGARNRCR